jgi:hypothetical protein
LSTGTVNNRLAALRFFYIKTLKKNWSIAETLYPKRPFHLPSILSQKKSRNSSMQRSLPTITFCGRAIVTEAGVVENRLYKKQFRGDREDHIGAGGLSREGGFPRLRIRADKRTGADARRFGGIGLTMKSPIG